MKTFTVAAVMLALLAVPAHAQARRPAGGDDKKVDQKKLQEKQQADDKAYKAKYDPWSIAKPAEPAKKPK